MSYRRRSPRIGCSWQLQVAEGMTDDVVMCVFLSEVEPVVDDMPFSLLLMTQQSLAGILTCADEPQSPQGDLPAGVALASQVVQCGWPPPWWSGQLALGPAKSKGLSPPMGTSAGSQGDLLLIHIDRVPLSPSYTWGRGLTWAPPPGHTGFTG